MVHHSAVNTSTESLVDIMLDALQAADRALRTLCWEAGDVAIFNEGGEAYEAMTAIQAAIAKAKG